MSYAFSSSRAWKRRLTRAIERHWRVAGFFIFLFIVEWFLYFRSAGHYFQADTVFLLYHRARSLSEFLRVHTTAAFGMVSSFIAPDIRIHSVSIFRSKTGRVQDSRLRNLHRKYSRGVCACYCIVQAAPGGSDRTFFRHSYNECLYDL